MPHLIIEHKNHPKINEICSNLHKKVGDFETVNIEALKTRSILCENFFCGQENQDKDFLHIRLFLLPGRSEELKEKFGHDIHAQVRKICDTSILSVEVLDLHTYIKD